MLPRNRWSATLHLVCIHESLLYCPEVANRNHEVTDLWRGRGQRRRRRGGGDEGRSRRGGGSSKVEGWAGVRGVGRGGAGVRGRVKALHPIIGQETSAMPSRSEGDCMTRLCVCPPFDVGRWSSDVGVVSSFVNPLDRDGCPHAELFTLQGLVTLDVIMEATVWDLNFFIATCRVVRLTVQTRNFGVATDRNASVRLPGPLFPPSSLPKRKKTKKMKRNVSKKKKHEKQNEKKRR